MPWRKLTQINNQYGRHGPKVKRANKKRRRKKKREIIGGKRGRKEEPTKAAKSWR